MPKISKETVYIPDQKLNRQPWVREIVFASKSKRFECVVPEYIGKVVNTSRLNIVVPTWSAEVVDRVQVNEKVHGNYILYAASYDKLIEYWDNVIWEYEKVLKQTKQKVIIIHFQANCYIFERPIDEACEDHSERWHKCGNCILRLDDISFAHGTALLLDYDVLWRIGDSLYKMGGGNEYLGKVDAPEKKWDGSVMIDFTEERYKFISDAKANLEHMIFNINSFMQTIHKNPGLLDSMIKDQKLLPGAKVEENKEEST